MREQTLARPLIAAYKRRLRPIVPAAPSCAGDEILSATEAVRDKRPALRLTDNSPKLHRGSKLCRKQ